MDLKLPLTLVGPSDITRLLRELKGLDDFFVATKARKSGTSMQPPRLTRLLDEMARENRINLLETQERTKLEDQLEQLQKSAPMLHLSFAAEPSPKALERILIWLRENIDAHALVRVGLQPSIAAGCVLRTPNKIFDMSLRAHLEKQEDYLVKLISGAVK